MPGHPLMAQRVAAIEKWQEEQTKTTRETATTLQAIQAALAAKAEERIGRLDRGTKILVAWLALGGTFLASLILTAGQIIIAFYK
jgi:hypothetical protein